MLDKSDYHEDEPGNQNDRNQEDTDDEYDEEWRCKCVNDEAEIEINNFKTSFFFERRELIFLNEIVENDEDEAECSAWEEISCEVQYAEHFDTFFTSRWCRFFDDGCSFFYHWLYDFGSYFFDWRFFWSCFLWSCCCFLRDWSSLFSCCLFWSRCLWSLFSWALFCSSFCFYHVRNTKQTLS